MKGFRFKFRARFLWESCHSVKPYAITCSLSKSNYDRIMTTAGKQRACQDRQSPIYFRPMKNPPFFTVLLLLSGLVSCSTKTLPSSPEKWHLPPKLDSEVSIMHFNVENLFDTEHDHDRDDETYLPKSQKQTPEHRALCAKMSPPYYKFECLNKDYTEEVVKQKMLNVSQVILDVDTHGPDVLVLEEVENIKILSCLNTEFLQTARYETIVLIEGPDKRGIDIGLLSRLPLAGNPVLHKPQIITDQGQDYAGHTRGILEVPLRLTTGNVLFVFGVHFPSPRSPRSWREQMLTQLINLVKSEEGKGAYKLLPETIDVVRYNPIHIYRDQFPLRWNDEKRVGVSDHFPIYSRIKVRDPFPEKSPPSLKSQEPKSVPGAEEDKSGK